ncbi:MAG: hypothetical protein E6G96_16120 [Alphaproteobacteria bacterium]|jgi:hypothetical protein|nr:MAG: hypothetical protein E6G96_16120 [Alphaproteobacteria bacterium]
MQIKGAQFQDIRADDREMIRSAARRAGLPVSQWLDSVIKSAAEASEQPSPAATDHGNETPKAEELSMTALHERIAQLATQIGRLVQQNESASAASDRPEGMLQLVRLEDAINRLTERLHSCVIEVPYEPSYQLQQSSPKPGLFSRLLASRH